jgi:hypothetical protein
MFFLLIKVALITWLPEKDETLYKELNFLTRAGSNLDRTLTPNAVRELMAFCVRTIKINPGSYARVQDR